MNWRHFSAHRVMADTGSEIALPGTGHVPPFGWAVWVSVEARRVGSVSTHYDGCHSESIRETVLPMGHDSCHNDRRAGDRRCRREPRASVLAGEPRVALHAARAPGAGLDPGALPRVPARRRRARREGRRRRGRLGQPRAGGRVPGRARGARGRRLAPPRDRERARARIGRRPALGRLDAARHRPGRQRAGGGPAARPRLPPGPDVRAGREGVRTGRAD